MPLTSLGKYTVTRPLGQGAMGEVYLAEDPDIGRSVAIKLIRSSSLEDQQRFRSEARIVGAFSHPNIVVLHDFGFHDDRPFLVLEYLPGESLESWLQRPHPLADSLRIMEGFLSALQYAHQRGVLHRDLKPSNIQVMPDGQCKLMDFGIAQAPTAKLTATGMVMGTPCYMSPEVLEDARYSTRADVYSAAVVLYEMLAGENPFLGKTLPATLNNVLTLEPFDLGALRADLPPELADGIMACLAKCPEDRPPDVSYLLEAVQAARAQSPLTTPRPAQLLATRSIRGVPAASLRRRRQRRAIAAGAASVVSLAVLGWLLLRRPAPVEQPGPPSPVAASTRPEPSLPPSPTAESPNPLGAPSARPQPRAMGQAPPSVPSLTPRLATEPRSVPPRPAGVPSLLPTPRPSAAASPPATAAVAGPPSAPQTEGPATTLDAVSPRTVRRGLMVALDLRGSGFRKGHQARILRGRQAVAGLRIVRQEVVETTVLRLTILVDEDVPLGTYAIVVVDAQGTPSNSVSFEVIL